MALRDWMAEDSAPAPKRGDRIGLSLLADGVIGSDDLVHALAAASRNGGRVLDHLRARGAANEEALLDAAARHFGVSRADLTRPLPAGDLIDRLGAQDCLRFGLVPWRRAGAGTVVATSRPEDFARLRPLLEERLGPVLMAVAPADAIETAVHARRGMRLARLAESRVPDALSCRGWGKSQGLAWVIFGLLSAAFLLAAAPWLLGFLLLGAALLSLALAMGLKIACSVAALRTPLPPADPPAIARLPPVSILVALYRESDIAPRLVRRLSRLDYPRELLDVILVVEAEDATTRAALARADLPPWMRVVTVPKGEVKTKPRALNLALDHCRGSIIGVYDAEDAPDPDQIRKVVSHFHRVGPDVACLQGMLTYYNPLTNWLSRCFTLEYAVWFRLLLPGVARLGLVVPLGGTTLFFRRQVLEELGGWDAHNVTEDADLGVRLTRAGYRTEVIETVTSEEACCHALPWVKQRSRWIKGYMMTWVVHMRDPALLWRELGAWRFFGFQVMFLGTILQFLLAPLLWSFWIVPFGGAHPIHAGMLPVMAKALTVVFLLSEVVNLALTLIALRRCGKKISPFWALTLPVYFPLAVLAAYKGLWELATRPFYWDKTRHGLFDQA